MKRRPHLALLLLAMIGLGLFSLGHAAMAGTAETDATETDVTETGTIDPDELLGRASRLLPRNWSDSEAEADLIRALELYRAGGDVRGQAECQLLRGLVRSRRETYAEARELLAESLDLWRRAGEPAGRWQTLYALAETQRHLGFSGESLRSLDEALGVLEALGEKPRIDPKIFRVVTLSQGLPLEQLAAPLLMDPTLQRGFLDNLFALTLISRSQGLAAQHRHDAALTALEKARERAASLRILTPQVLNAMGTVHLQRGEPERATEHFEKARQAAHQLFVNLRGYFVQVGMPASVAAVVRFGEVDALKGLAAVGIQNAHHVEALENLRDAMAIARALGQPTLQAELLLLLGKLELARGHIGQAHRRYEVALEIARKAGDLEGEAAVLDELSLVAHLEGWSEEAFALQGQALEIFRTLDHRMGIGRTHLQRGRLLHALGLAPKAFDELETGLAIIREIEIPTLEKEILLATAWIHLETGDTRGGRRYAEEALALARRLTEPTSEIHALVLLARADDDLADLEAALEIALEIEHLESEAAIRRELGVGFSKLGLDDRAAHELKQALDLFRRLAVKEQEALTQAILAAVRRRQGRTDEAFELFRRAAEKLAVQQGRLHRTDLAQSFNATSPAIVRSLLVEMAAELGAPEEAFFHAENSRGRAYLDELARRAGEEDGGRVLDLETIRETLLEEDTSLVAYFLTSGGVLAWVVGRDGARMIDLDLDPGRLAKSVTQFTDHLDSRDFDVLLASRLHHELIGPLLPYLEGSRLIVVPHGALHDLPVAALWNGRTERFLVEDFALSQAPSASALRLLKERRPSVDGKILLLGDPPGDHKLEGARDEVLTLASLYGADAWTGAEASEARLRTAAPDAALIHLATHGAFDGADVRYPHLVLAPGGGHDGRLEAREIKALDLEGTRLVVLPACHSAQGVRTRGDDIEGLTRAVLAAGSRVVVTARWSIDDAASRFLMEAFHRRLFAGERPDVALRGAQLETRAHPKWSAPTFWATFTLSGAVDDPPRRSKIR